MPGYIASSKYNMVYLNMPKAACTTLKNYLYFLDHGAVFDDPLDIHNKTVDLFLTYDRNRAAIHRKFRTSIFFTFVRHPLRRAYSLFNEKVFNQWKYSFPGVRDTLVEHYGARFDSNEDVDQHRGNFLRFLYFIRDTKEDRIQYRKDFHWMPQSYILAEALRMRSMDFIGRVETFDRDFRYVLEAIGYDAPFDYRKFNEGNFTGTKYEDIVNDEIRDIGMSIYRKDFEDFAYQND